MLLRLLLLRGGRTNHRAERKAKHRRVIEGMSTEETANLLGLQPDTVKTRLHRARRLVRKELDKQIGPVLMDAFPFAGRRCARMTNAVLQRLDVFE